MANIKSTTRTFCSVFSFKVNFRKTLRDAVRAYIIGAVVLFSLNMEFTPDLQVAFALFGGLGGSVSDVVKLFMTLMRSPSSSQDDDAALTQGEDNVN